jgi:homoserine O-acetyltransferase
MNQIFKYPYPLSLEFGEVLPEIQIQYSYYGHYIPGKSRVIWVCHALTANAEVMDWWPGLFGKQDFFNTDQFFIVCANILGSCYGTTGPLSLNPETGNPYYHRFPEITIRDMVKAHILLADHLGIEKIDFLLGGSLGGQQTMEWAIEEPQRIEKIGLIATNAQHSPWGIAFNESQRMAIATDSSWKEDGPEAGMEGLKTARSIALLTYRNYRTYQSKQLNEEMVRVETYKASTYQQYQGLKLARRFNAYSYWTLSRAMDSHNIGRNRQGLASALNKILCPSLIIGISSDLLFPIEEQEFLYHHIPKADLAVIDSLYGHDGFLMETPSLKQIISGFLQD